MSGEPVVRIAGLSCRYGPVLAVDDLTLVLPGGCMVGLIGPDGAGKSSLLSLLAGARKIQTGTIHVLGGDLADPRHREAVCSRIAYMPQGLGRNLYPTLSVEENLQFFARLFGHGTAERRRRIDQLTRSLGLESFLARPAGKLSGGMKQKLALCCALIHDPELLILDEPTTGVDPLARSRFWELIDGIRAVRPGMSVIVATAYLGEASRFAWLVAVDGGKVLATGTPAELLARTATDSLDGAFLALLPEARRRDHRPVVLPPLPTPAQGAAPELVIEATDLSKDFAGFQAVDHVSLAIRKGEIFGFIGSNGCGKSTTMKMLTGLLPASGGTATLLGQPIAAEDLTIRRRVGYMSQGFSLYGELTVRQNLDLHARLFQVPAAEIPGREAAMLERFGLEPVADALPATLPPGLRQRLSLAVAMVHRPEVLILDEPTSGVDPIARDRLWQLMIDLSRNDRVTIFISTHFMVEAGRCDRVALMHAGKVLVTGVPGELVGLRRVESLETAFISYLREAEAAQPEHPEEVTVSAPVAATPSTSGTPGKTWFSLTRAWSCTRRETLELRRDPVRATLALLGTALLMLVIAFGISLDVEDMTFAVLDRDQTTVSRDYALGLSGSRYFVEHPPLTTYADLDRRMRSGELALAIEIPHGFARDLARGNPAQIGAWVDGAMPRRAETVQGYVQGMHQNWLVDAARRKLGQEPGPGAAQIATRFRYNPDVKSLPAMVPAVIPMLLLMIPAMLAALSVVREKELGSILNLYVTPLTRSEFLLGKQFPYVVLGLLNFLLMTFLAVTFFAVPLRGSFFALALSALVFVGFSTGFGLFVSTFTRSQIAALFLAIIGTMIPAVQFAGMLNPVSSLEGLGRIIGELYPVSYFLTISRGVFSKALDLAGLWPLLWPMLVAVPVILGMSIFLLKKQED